MRSRIPSSRHHSGRSGLLVLVGALMCAGLLAGCSDDPSGPSGPLAAGVLALNSTGQTLAAFSIGEGIEAAGETDLGAGFDGDGVSLSPSHAVTTVSSLNGSQIRFVDLENASVQIVPFPDPDGALADPGRATFDEGGSAWVGGRGSDAVYRADPGDAVATRVAADVGEYVERVVPVGDLLYAVDANVDDDGFTFAPLGPSRVVVLERGGATKRVLDLPEAAPNARDAVLVSGKLVVLGGGTFDENFAANGNGALVVVDTGDDTVSEPFALGGNGVAIEAGADGLIYVTRTVDFQTLDVLVFDPGSETFVHGPGNPLLVLDQGAVRVDCWVTTALADGRLLCATFNFAEPGRLLVTAPDGVALSEVASGFGTTDLQLR